MMMTLTMAVTWLAGFIIGLCVGAYKAPKDPWLYTLMLAYKRGLLSKEELVERIKWVG